MDLFTLDNLVTLVLLVMLQAVLGFDNLLYLSMESQRVRKDKQRYVRQVGVALAIVLRIVLLFVLMEAIDAFQDPFVTLDHAWFHIDMNGHALIVLIGGGFIVYTAVKEIFHMLVAHEPGEGGGKRAQRSVASAIFWIVIMNLVFSFDSILSAIALTKNVWIMGIAIIVSGILMIWMADHVSEFLKKNRMYEVLGLFILFIVGILLVSEGAHLAHLHLFSYEIQPMAKATFYFVIAILVVVDVIQGRYQKKLLAEAGH